GSNWMRRLLSLPQRRLVRLHHFLAEAGENHLLDCSITAEEIRNSPYRDACCVCDGIAVDAAADGGKGDRAHPVRHGKRETLRIAAGQQLRFAMPAVSVARTHSVD